MKPRRWILTAAILLAFPGAAAASHLDGELFNFEQSDGTDFSSSFCRHALPCDINSPPLTTFATSTFSGKYLGAFGEETLSFSALDMLDIIALQADRAYLSFDLIMTGFWFGAENAQDPGFETRFEVAANGKTVFDSPVDNNLPGPRHFDLIFDFTPNSPNCCTDVLIEWSASFGSGFDTWEFPEFDPRWGIDNFVVSSTPIPESSTGALVGLGLGVLAARRRDPTARL